MSHPLIQKYVVLMGVNYIYCGILEGVAHDYWVLGEPSIVYETGPWKSKKWKDAQPLPTNRAYIERSGSEAIFELIRGRR